MKRINWRNYALCGASLAAWWMICFPLASLLMCAPAGWRSAAVCIAGDIAILNYFTFCRPIVNRKVR